jgi:hypothetical protein
VKTKPTRALRHGERPRHHCKSDRWRHGHHFAPSTRDRLSQPDVTAHGADLGQAGSQSGGQLSSKPAWVQSLGRRHRELHSRSSRLSGMARPLAVLPLEIIRIGGLKLARFAGTAFSNANTGLVGEHALADETSAWNEVAAALKQAGLAADLVLFDKMPPEAAKRRPSMRCRACCIRIPVSSCRCFRISRSAGTDQSQAPKEEIPAVRTASRSHWRIPPYHRRR